MLRALIAALLVAGGTAPALAGTPDRGHGTSDGVERSGFFLKKDGAKPKARKSRKASAIEEPFCVRPFEYPRQRY